MFNHGTFFLKSFIQTAKENLPLLIMMTCVIKNIFNLRYMRKVIYMKEQLTGMING
jgi:hypothetical protein